ncbi:MAG TPA: glycoside hydrolase family 71/99-like protein [Armatimonadota bacterium]|nr:glycoside hydrolase family 71/99-like protein [Armatimonadota bacterium]
MALLEAICLMMLPLACSAAAQGSGGIVDATTLRGKIMCGYQGWFRCPGDAENQGWDHWSRNRARIAPDTLTFEMWPDMSDYPTTERFDALGFTYPDGKPASLFSSDNAATILRHFQWMRDYGIDGAWMQFFLVGLPGGPLESHYRSRRRVLDDAARAALKTGRVWALSYDIAAMPTDRIYEVLTRNWKQLVDEELVHGPRYLHYHGLPVVQIWGFYWNNKSNLMTPELGNRLIDFFAAPGRYHAFLVGGGDWNWRSNPDPKWQALYHRFQAYAPWNVGNVSIGPKGALRATTHYWKADKQDCDARGALWIPVIYPGFSWDNLKREPAGQSNIPRRRGQFLWEQFRELSAMGVDTVYVAMFDEVDEGTAIFKVTSAPPVQAHFVGYGGLPSDWYLRLVGLGSKMLHKKQPVPAAIPIVP